MGPHGIMVGATGSGKSELLRSITAALAARHDPGLLNLLLVDFKGGAAFAGLEPLPHVAGLVTNLAEETDLIARVKAALAGELERRQRLLRDAGDLSSISEYHRRWARRERPGRRRRNDRAVALPGRDRRRVRRTTRGRAWFCRHFQHDRANGAQPRCPPLTRHPAPRRGPGTSPRAPLALPLGPTDFQRGRIAQRARLAGCL